MSEETREQSEDWYDHATTVAADELGPFEDLGSFLLVATADFTEEEDGYVTIHGTVRVVVTDTNTDSVLLDQEFGPVWGDEFSTLDHDRWKLAAEAAIKAAGYDLDALLASLRDDAA